MTTKGNRQHRIDVYCHFAMKNGARTVGET